MKKIILNLIINLVKNVCKQIRFDNPFNATKIDNIEKLPDHLRKNDYAIIHTGQGKHMFIKGINRIFHKFEPIQKNISWNYTKSLLNHYNSSESNILSVANNQRILHHFLFGQDKEFENVHIMERPKTYFPHRTKTSFKYNLGNEHILTLQNIQIEIDLTIEWQGIIGVFEGKNGTPNSFAIYQIYHPFLYYHKANTQEALKGKIKKILCIYVVREKENQTNLNQIMGIYFHKTIRYDFHNFY